MTINAASNNPRIEYTVAEGAETTQFSIPFEFFEDPEVKLYVDGVLKTQGSGDGKYTVTGGEGSTGTATFNTVSSGTQPVTGISGGSTVIIFRDIPIERVTDFSAGADINRAALNTQLDTLTALVSDADTNITRSLAAPVTDVDDVTGAVDMTLPVKAGRLGKVLGFNSSTGNPEAVDADVTDATNVTASGALMDSEVTNLSQVKSFDSSDYATAAQGTTADAAMPKAGGTFTGNTSYGDNDKIIMGDGNDLQIYSDGDASHIDESGTGNFVVKATNIQFTGDNNESLAWFVADGPVSLYHNGVDVAQTSNSGFNVNGDITASGTVDGRDLATDGDKLDLIEASADVTDTANVVSSLTAGTNVSIASNGTISATDTNTTYTSSDFTHDDLTGFVANEHIDWTSDQGLTNIHSGNYQNTTYSEGDGGLTQKNFTTTLKNKLDAVEASADVTDTDNVTAAGALMDSEVTNLAQVKAFDSSDYATTAQGSTADAAMPTTGGTFTGDVTLFNDGGGNGRGPDLNLKRDSASPAAWDWLGAVRFLGEDGASNETAYASILGRIVDPTSGSEDGRLEIWQQKAAASTLTYAFDHDTFKLINEQTLQWEDHGSTSYDVTLAASTPTADRTITLPDATGTVLLADGDGSNLTNVEASKVYINEVSDHLYDTDLNVLFSDTSGSGNVQMQPKQDNGGLTFNPDQNILKVQDIQVDDVSSKSSNSHLYLRNYHDNYGVYIQTDNGSGGVTTYVSADGNTGEAGLYHYGNSKLKTKAGGVDITGDITVSGTVDGRDIAVNIPSSLGTAGQVLTVNSGASAAEWAAASGGGGGADLYAANESSPTAQPSATGANAVAIGDQAIASGPDSFAIGEHSDATGTRTHAFGFAAVATHTNALALGTSRAFAAGATAISIANNSTSYGASGSNSIAIGDLAKASHANAIVLGDTAASSAANEITLGSTSDTVRISSAYTLPTSDGTNGQVLTTDGSGAVTFADAGGGSSFTLVQENYSNDTAPNVTGNDSVGIGGSVVVSASDSVAMGYYAKVEGAMSVAIGLQAHVTTGASQAIAIGDNAKVNAGTSGVALGTSYVSATDAFAAAIGTNSSSYGASGSNSIAGGDYNKATATDSLCWGGDSNVAQSGAKSAVVGGWQNNCSGAYSFISGGRGNKITSGSYSRAGGLQADVNGTGIDTWSSGRFSSDGDAQTSKRVLIASTTDATATVLGTQNINSLAANQVTLPNNSAYAFHGTIVARQQAADGTACAAWKVEGLIRREGSAGTTVLVNSATTVLDNTPSWGMTLSADTTNGCLKIQATGAAATDIRWVATIHTSEVTYA